MGKGQGINGGEAKATLTPRRWALRNGPGTVFRAVSGPAHFKSFMTTEMQLPASELKEALAGFNKIIGKTSLPVLWHVRVIKPETGPVHLQATNLDEFATFTFSNESSSASVDLLMPFDQLLKVGKTCAKKETVLIRKKGEAFFIAYSLGSNLIEQRITTMDLAEWPPVPSFDGSEAVVVGKEFKTAIRDALDCSSTDSTRLILNSAYVDVSDPAAHYVVGTNGSHLYAANSFKLDLKESLIVPNRRFLTWKGFIANGDWSLSIKAPVGENDPGWVQVMSLHWTFVAKRIDDTYPNWRNPIPDSRRKHTTIELSDDAMRFMLNVVPKLPGDEQNQSVGLLVNERKQLVLLAKSKDDQHHSEISVDAATVHGPANSVFVNRAYLLKAVRLGLNQLEIYGPEETMVFRGDKARLVVAPFRSEYRPPTSKEPPDQTESNQPSSEDTTDQEMKTTNRIEQNDTTTVQETADAKESAFSKLHEQVETIKNTLKGVVSELNDVLKLVTQAQREKRATEKEIENIRETLQSLQRIRI